MKGNVDNRIVNLAVLIEKKKSLTLERKQAMLRAGGSLKTCHVIDAQSVCRQMRDKSD